MIRFKLSVPLAALCLSLLCQPAPVQANLLTNGDFSSGSLGWETSGSAMVTDYAGIPDTYSQRWDLSTWQNAMSGNFMLVEGGGVNLLTKVQVSESFSSLSLSLNYALAWDWTTQLSPTDYGYMYMQVFGQGTDGINRPFSYTELDWGPMISGLATGGQTGSLISPMIVNSDGRFYKELLVNISVFNPNQTLLQIVGLDGVSLTDSSSPTVPAPEPSTMLLLGVALMGTVLVAGKQKRRATRS